MVLLRGTRRTLLSIPRLGPELLVDGNMEAVAFTDWIIGASATTTKIAGARTGGGGAQIGRVARNGTNNPYIQQSILTVGTRYKFSAWPRSDGNASVLIWVGGSGNSITSTSSTSWQFVNGIFIAVDAHVLMFSITSTGTEYLEWDDVSVREVL